MGRINKLSKDIYEKIAAGEVVERPASVCKELLENAIDAGSTDITLEIQHGGIKYIRITDNGCGIHREDVKLAFLSHATSKIAKADDLFSIGTLGFRGEALPSIAAVSKTELMTRTSDSEIGTRIVMEGGEEKSFDDAGCPQGTTIIIRDLFYNTPARMKFLKTDRAEGTAVAAVVDKLALSHPEISFRFIKDGKQQICTSGNGKLLSAIYSVFGKDFSDTLIPVEYTVNMVSVKGFISKPFASRGSNSMQMFFVNNRYIKNRTAAAALSEAYKNSVMVGKYPACVLFMTVNPTAVDVNVHPAKTEVRFSNEKAIFDAVYYAAKSALNLDNSHPQVSLKNASRLMSPPITESVQQSFTSIPDPISREPIQKAEPVFSQPKPTEPVAEFIPSVQPVVSNAVLQDSVQNTYEPEEPQEDEFDLSVRTANPVPPAVQQPILEEFEETTVEEEPPKEVCVVDATRAEKPLHMLGEAFKAFIFAEYDGKLIIIDKHAAHERMLFNQLKKENGKNGSQMFLSPVHVVLSKEEYNAVLENIDLLQQAGFDVEDFGEGSVLVRACPLNLEKEDLTALITEIAGYLLKSHKDILPEKLDWIYHSMSCRAAIKAGNDTSDYELLEFTKRLLQDDEVKYCPHGRPVMIELTRYELDKQFGRVQ